MRGATENDAPLSGIRIVVTRPEKQAASLAGELQRNGAEVFLFPTIEIAHTDWHKDFNPPYGFDWLLFTSANAADSFAEGLAATGQSISDWGKTPKICCLGPATAHAAERNGFNVDLVPPKFIAEDMLEELKRFDSELSARRILIPRSDIARPFLPEMLRAHGADTVELITYRTTAPEYPEEEKDFLIRFGPDIVAFASSSSVKNFRSILGGDRIKKIGNTIYAVIGPETAAAAHEYGIAPVFQAEIYNSAGLVQAIIDCVGKNKRNRP